MLSTGSISVGSVAKMCGFHDVFYFSKVFKARSGLTPTEYMKNGGKGQITSDSSTLPVDTFSPS